MSDPAPPIVHLASVAQAFREGDAERQVLAGVDLEVREGESVALLGRSGSGKSSLLNLVGGLDAPKAGSVTVCGAELGAMTEAERTAFRRRHIGFVFQSFHLLPTLTVMENVLMPLELERRVGAADRDRARSLLERVGLLERHAAFPDVLSGGEQQRVAIARALVHDPVVLLADEPTGNLDSRAAAVVLDLLFDAAATRTVLLATHSGEAAARCDRVLEIREGRLRPRAAATRSAPA